MGRRRHRERSKRQKSNCHPPFSFKPTFTTHGVASPKPNEEPSPATIVIEVPRDLRESPSYIQSQTSKKNREAVITRPMFSTIDGKDSDDNNEESYGSDEIEEDETESSTGEAADISRRAARSEANADTGIDQEKSSSSSSSSPVLQMPKPSLKRKLFTLANTASASSKLNKAIHPVTASTSAPLALASATANKRARRSKSSGISVQAISSSEAFAALERMLPPHYLTDTRSRSTTTGNIIATATAARNFIRDISLRSVLAGPGMLTELARIAEERQQRIQVLEAQVRRLKREMKK